MPRETALHVVLATQFHGASPPPPRRYRANPDGTRFMTWTLPTERGAWVVQGDPSMLRDKIPLDHCTEVSTPPMAPGVNTWQATLQGLADAGARLTPHCGLHVHVDAAGLSPLALARVVFLNGALMSDAGITVSALRRRYTQPVSPAVLALAEREHVSAEELWGAWYGDGNVPPLGKDHRNRSRRRDVNLHSVRYRGTIEFRWPAMSLDVADVAHTLHRCADVVQRAEESC